MLIGIDGNEANQKSKVGIGQFAFNVIKELERVDQESHYIIYLKEAPLDNLPKERAGWRYEVFGPGKAWTQFALPIKLFTQKKKLNVFYSPSHYSPRFSPFPTVVSIMDLWHHHHPEQFDKKDLYPLTRWEGYSVKNASRIVTISEFSKSEIIKIYKYPPERITVAYPGYDNFKSNTKNQIVKIKNKYEIKNKYLLYLGTLQPKKNLERLVEAWSFIGHKYPDIQLVIAGKKGWLFEEIFARVKELGLENRVIFPGFVDEEEKPYLISGAEAFVLPSLYEGFGIPVAEAMSLGVLVICARAGSLPEVGGKAAIYCDPYSVESIAGAINRVIGLNKRRRDEIIALGLKQVKKFSWEKCAKKVLETLEQAVSDRLSAA